MSYILLPFKCELSLGAGVIKKVKFPCLKKTINGPGLLYYFPSKLKLSMLIAGYRTSTEVQKKK